MGGGIDSPQIRIEIAVCASCSAPAVVGLGGAVMVPCAERRRQASMPTIMAHATQKPAASGKNDHTPSGCDISAHDVSSSVTAASIIPAATAMTWLARPSLPSVSTQNTRDEPRAVSRYVNTVAISAWRMGPIAIFDHKKHRMRHELGETAARADLCGI